MFVDEALTSNVSAKVCNQNQEGRWQNKVEYTSNVEATEYYIYELTRAALRDVSKFIRKKWQELYDSHFVKRTGEGRKATNYTVISGQYTQYPRAQIGLKSGKVDGFYAYFQEFGTSKQKAWITFESSK